MNTYPVLGIKHLTKNTFRLRVKRPDITIISGQCFNVGIPELGINREYSMYSSADSKHLDFLIRSVDGGLISSELQKLKPGDLVEVDGAYGEFCLKNPLNKNLNYLFIATGTGIAPFHSFVETNNEIKYKILHGVRSKNECYDVNDYVDGAYIPCISKPNGSDKGKRVTDYLSSIELPMNVQVYVCGNRNMIIDVFDILSSKGVSGDQIKTEVFF
jgi:ferredoxin/flavodoxin---NADP+ reductase